MRAQDVVAKRRRGEERPLLSGHMGIELIREILDALRDFGSGARQELPERRVLGDMRLEHSIDQQRAPRGRAVKEPSDHVGLGRVVQREFLAKNLERRIKLATDTLT